MDRYLLIESLDPFESNDVEHWQDLAADLVREGNQVTVFLVQNGVLAARRGARSGGLQALTEQRVELLADEFSLRERGIPESRLAPAVRPARLEVVIDRLADDWKVLWH
jgi:sulfur relay (sulfurtransferase) complex TusBCD TusD component (DsrE family)